MSRVAELLEQPGHAPFERRTYPLLARVRELLLVRRPLARDVLHDPTREQAGSLGRIAGPAAQLLEPARDRAEAAAPTEALLLMFAPSDLCEARVLLLDDGHCFRDQAVAYCSNAHARELEFRATSLTTLAQMVAGGTGVTLLPQLAVPTEAERARLNVRAFARPVPHRTIALVWRKRSPLADALRKIAGTIRGAYPSRGATRRGTAGPRPSSSAD